MSFFFVKQKTAYEMRISDWSSDVCSSDLLVDDVFERRTAEDALAQRGDRRTALDDRAHFHAAGRAAIFLDHDAILRHVDQTAGQVTRVRRLERRIGQTLTRTVGDRQSTRLNSSH